MSYTTRIVFFYGKVNWLGSCPHHDSAGGGVVVGRSGAGWNPGGWYGGPLTAAPGRPSPARR